MGTMGREGELVCGQPASTGWSTLRGLWPRASSLRIFGLEGARGAIAILADDRTLRARICERVRLLGLIPLPFLTPLDAVITLERTSLETAVVAAFALGLPAHAIVDFLAVEYPSVKCVVLDPDIDPHLAARVFACAQDLDDLERTLVRISRTPLASSRALVIIAHASWRRTVCDCLAELGWDAVGIADLGGAVRTASSRFDVAVLDDPWQEHYPDDIARLRMIVPGLPAIVLSPSSAPFMTTPNTVLTDSSFAAIARALAAVLSPRPPAR